MQPNRLASALASKIKPAETHKRVSFTENLNNQQEFEVEDWSEELSSSRSQMAGVFKQQPRLVPSFNGNTGTDESLTPTATPPLSSYEKAPPRPEALDLRNIRPGEEMARLDLTGVTDGEWKVLESGDREAMLQMLYDANKVLLELPKGDRKSMKTKIETIETMLDTHKQLGHPKTSPEQRRALAIAYRRSGRLESPPTLFESPSVQSPQRGEWLDQTQV